MWSLTQAISQWGDREKEGDVVDLTIYNELGVYDYLSVPKRKPNPERARHISYVLRYYS